MDRKQSPSPNLAGGFFVYDAAERGRREERFFSFARNGTENIVETKGNEKKTKKNLKSR